MEAMTAHAYCPPASRPFSVNPPIADKRWLPAMLPSAVTTVTGFSFFHPNLHHAQPKIALSLGQSSPKRHSQSAPHLHRICTGRAPHLHRICLLPSADCLHPASRQGGDIVD